jgi:hypothetical protein
MAELPRRCLQSRELREGGNGTVLYIQSLLSLSELLHNLSEIQLPLLSIRIKMSPASAEMYTREKEINKTEYLGAMR